MIGVEDGDEVRIDHGEGVVDVPRLRVLAAGPSEIAGAERFGELGDLGSVAIVQQPCLVDRFERRGGGDRRHEDLRALVVGWNEDGDAWPAPRRAARRPPVDVPQAEREEGQPDGRVNLEGEHGHTDVPRVEVDREQRAPPQIRARHRQGGDRDSANQEEASRALGERELPAATHRACHAAHETMRRTIGP